MVKKNGVLEKDEATLIAEYERAVFETITIHGSARKAAMECARRDRRKDDRTLSAS